MSLFGKKKESPPACNCAAPARDASEVTAARCCDNMPDGICCVKVLGTGCKNCHAMWEAAKEAVRSMGLDIEVEYVTDLQQIMAYGVMSMPALVFNEQVVSMGRVLKVTDIERLLTAMISRS